MTQIFARSANAVSRLTILGAVVTLVGVGGVGKTALAVEAAWTEVSAGCLADGARKRAGAFGMAGQERRSLPHAPSHNYCNKEKHQDVEEQYPSRL